MNWLSLITELESLIFWLASLILLAPKTLYSIIRRPKTMIPVLSQEMVKPSDEKYDAYISPITFWIIFSIFLLILLTILQEYIGFLVSSVIGGGSTDIKDFEFNFSTNRITKSIIISIWFPLVFSYIVLLRQKNNLTKKNLENIFYMHCYLFGSFVALYTILSAFLTFICLFLPIKFSYFISLVNPSNVPINWLGFVLAFIWFINFELQLYKFYSVTHRIITSYTLIFLSFSIAITVSYLTMWFFIQIFDWPL